MKNKCRILLAVQVVLLCLSVGFAVFFAIKSTGKDDRYKETFDYVFRSNNIEFDDVIFVEKINNSILLFYRHEYVNGTDGLGICIMEHTDDGWKVTEKKEDPGFKRVSVNVASVGDKVLAYGYIADNEAAYIKIINNEKDAGYAQIIYTKWKRLWVREIEKGSLKIEVYDKNGVKMY